MAGKDSGLRIRVERPLREAFLEACRTEDRPAAQVIREFMRDYVAGHRPKKDEDRTITRSIRLKRTNRSKRKQGSGAYEGQ